MSSLYVFLLLDAHPTSPSILLDNTGHPAPDQQTQVTKLFTKKSLHYVKVRKKFFEETNLYSLHLVYVQLHLKSFTVHLVSS